MCLQLFTFLLNVVGDSNVPSLYLDGNAFAGAEKPHLVLHTFSKINNFVISYPILLIFF